MKNQRMSIKLFLLGIILALLTACKAQSNINVPHPFIFSTLPATLISQGQSSQTPLPTTTLPVSSNPGGTPLATATQYPSRTPPPPTPQPPSPIPTNSMNVTGIGSSGPGTIKTVFLIVMENHNWSDIYNSPSAPYINQTLLPQASYATQYFNPAGNHPSEPNYLWLEAGTNYGVKNDNGPKSNHQSSTDHLVTYLDKAGITWKAYEEGITGKVCPIKATGLYAPKHNPMVFFDNVTGTNDPNSAYCIAHERPFSEMKTDLQNNKAAQYIFITPNLCNDMHNDGGCQSTDSVKNGDTWLSKQIPMIMASEAYKQGGVIFITWDESESGDQPIGMIVLSPFAKGGGYSNSVYYTHSSTLKTIQEIFHITPLLGDASNATDLSDLFTRFP